MAKTDLRPIVKQIVEPCPACGNDAFFNQVLDRFFHEDGSDNLGCWLHITRGETIVAIPVKKCERCLRGGDRCEKCVEQTELPNGHFVCCCYFHGETR